jgi:hypothetical protein
LENFNFVACVARQIDSTLALDAGFVERAELQTGEQQDANDELAIKTLETLLAARPPRPKVIGFTA